MSGGLVPSPTGWLQIPGRLLSPETEDLDKYLIGPGSVKRPAIDGIISQAERCRWGWLSVKKEIRTIDPVEDWLGQQRLFELIDPEKISSFLKQHQEILWKLDTLAGEIFSAFTYKKRRPRLSIKYWLDSSEDGKFSEEFLVVRVWVRMDPEEAFRRTKLFNRWWLEQPTWLRHPVIIDVSFERHE
jgi:hypothetical protein